MEEDKISKPAKKNSHAFTEVETAVEVSWSSPNTRTDEGAEFLRRKRRKKKDPCCGLYSFFMCKSTKKSNSTH